MESEPCLNGRNEKYFFCGAIKLQAITGLIILAEVSEAEKIEEEQESHLRRPKLNIVRVGVAIIFQHNLGVCNTFKYFLIGPHRDGST